jgi:iron complex transport system ATP-binding protein
MTLRLEAVGVSLGDREILRDVSCCAAPGEVVGVLGRNGVGKTTLLRVACGTLAPDSGRVLLDGEPIAAFSRRALARRVAVVPQDLHVPFPFLAGEVVLMGRTPHQNWFGFESPTDVRCAREAMERMGILELENRSVLELSGGERQLVMFARALAQSPEILLLDEPTAFLDLSHRIEVLQIVRELAAAGGSALVVSHDLALSARVCDRLVVLAEGGVVAQGSPAEVLQTELLRRAFGIDADILSGPDGLPVIVPTLTGSRPGTFPENSR